MSSLDKERHQLEDASAHLLEAALKAGAQAAEVCSTYTNKTKITLEKQDFHLASSDEGFRLGLRVLKNRRQGFCSCNTLDTSDLREIATKAVEIASFSPENPHDTIQMAQNIPSQAPQPIFDEGLNNLSLQTQKDWTKLLRDEALKDKRFSINDGSVETGANISLVLNSAGVRQIEKDAFCSWSLMGMGIEGSEITSFDYFHWLSRTTRTTPELLVKSTRAFTKEVLASLKTGVPKSYKGAVLFSPRAVTDILLDGLTYHLNGRNLVEATARWKFLDLGKDVLNKAITVKDAPWLLDRSGFTLFDREGTPTSNRTLIGEGILKGFLLDHYAAHGLETQSTGNAAGSSASIPSVGSHCLLVQGGSHSLPDLMKAPGTKQQHLLLVHRFSGQVDPITGDFSGVAKGGEWIQQGDSLYFVKETLIAGNVFDALTNGILGVSKDTHVIHAGDEAPFMLIDNISVTAHAS